MTVDEMRKWGAAKIAHTLLAGELWLAVAEICERLETHGMVARQDDQREGREQHPDTKIA